MLQTDICLQMGCVSAAISSSTEYLERMFLTIFLIISIRASSSDVKLTNKKWPELGSGQKYVTFSLQIHVYDYFTVLNESRSSDSEQQQLTTINWSRLCVAGAGAVDGHRRQETAAHRSDKCHDCRPRRYDRLSRTTGNVALLQAVAVHLSFIHSIRMMDYINVRPKADV